MRRKVWYNPEFVNMIKKGEADIKAGKGIKVNIDELFDKALQDIQERRITASSLARRNFLERRKK
ncbi:MAG: DUF2683 family protein [Mucilaginibacter sp.]